MKLTIFDGSKGDSLLLQSDGGANILVDGGNAGSRGWKNDSYSPNIAPTLGALREAGQALDLLVVSHIDQDHIGGILILLQDELDWRVFDYQRAQNLEVDPPNNPRPPQIDQIWHNAFHLLISKNRRAITSVLAAGSGLFDMPDAGIRDLDQSMREAALVSSLIGDGQLNIPLNTSFDGKLVQRNDQTPTIALKDCAITVLGPSRKALIKLRKEWNNWLRSDSGKKTKAEILGRLEQVEDLFAAADLNAALAELGPAIASRSSVTTPNVASIVMMVENNGVSVLLTGDARDDDIIDDLIDTGLAGPDGHIHVDVLKVQHHGSEHNFSAGFAARVTADHYIFCGNGAHKNPDLRVVQQVINSRTPDHVDFSLNNQAADEYKLWFTSDGTTFDARKDHMNKLIKLVKGHSDSQGSNLKFAFSNDLFTELNI